MKRYMGYTEGRVAISYMSSAPTAGAISKLKVTLYEYL